MVSFAITVVMARLEIASVHYHTFQPIIGILNLQHIHRILDWFVVFMARRKKLESLQMQNEDFWQIAQFSAFTTCSATFCAFVIF